jgi:hypothetical protein
MEAAAAAWSAIPLSTPELQSSAFTGLLDRREGSPPPTAYIGEEWASVVVDDRSEMQMGRMHISRDSGLRRCVAYDGV